MSTDTPPEWQRVEDLFHSALERDPGSRSVFLDQACAGDTELRREVESLIAAYGRVGSFIEEPAGAPELQANPPRPSLPAGYQIGPYELIGMLGAGGMGEVYRALDPRLGRDVALKVLPFALVNDPKRRERFLREARMVSALNHPNICTIHEIGSAAGVDYICFEYIEGLTLATMLDGPVLPFGRLLTIAVSLAEALAYAHGKGILHRDLKPSNIMITERGAKILDFGLAKSLSAPESGRGPTSDLSDSGLVMGTAAYMSPEQALGRRVDERSDIFSLGAVLYEMASGKQAFVGNTPSEVLDAILHRHPTPLLRLQPELPDGLSLVVEKALGKDASDRYPRMADLAADLRRLEGGRGGLIAGRRRRIARAAIVATAAASITAALALPGRWQTAPPLPPLDSLAVMYFENLADRTDADSIGRMLEGLVTTDLASAEGLHVVTSQRLYDIARQLGKPEGRPDRTVATDVARRAGATRMVLGQVARAGPRMLATAELVEVETGRGLGSFRAEGSSPEDVFSMAERLGAQLRGTITGRPAQPGVALTRRLTASADAYRAYVRGEALFHRVDWDGATTEFRRAAALDPNFALAHYRLSIVTSYLGHRGHAGPESRAAAQRAVALKQTLSRADQDIVEANLVFNAGRLSEAVPLLESALARDPDNKDLLHLLSECYMHSPKDADPRRAAALMERLLALDPAYRVVYHHLVIAYLLLGEPGRISAKLDEWDAQEPRFVVVLRGWLLGAQGRVDEALRLLESSQDENAMFLRCGLALGSGRWDIVRSIVSRHGKDANYGYFVPLTEAHLYVNLGELRRAEAAYRSVPPPPPEMGEGSRLILAYHGLAELLAAKGDLKGAQREAERGLAAQPEGPYCLYFAGLFAVRSGDLAAADGRLRRLQGIAAVARGPLVPHYRDALSAEIELARGRPAQAQVLLAKAVESGKLGYEGMQFTPGPLIRDALARSYLAMGERTKAAEVWEAFVKRPGGVDHPAVLIRAYYTLGALKLDLGDRDGGRQLLQRFLEQWGKADGDIPEVRDARARLASLER
jgi:eukaryotic-like serine/threonine-protein kinase